MHNKRRAAYLASNLLERTSHANINPLYRYNWRYKDISTNLELFERPKHYKQRLIDNLASNNDRISAKRLKILNSGKTNKRKEECAKSVS